LLSNKKGLFSALFLCPGKGCILILSGTEIRVCPEMEGTFKMLEQFLNANTTELFTQAFGYIHNGVVRHAICR